MAAEYTSTNRGITLWPPVRFEKLVWLISEGGDARRSSRDRTYQSAILDRDRRGQHAHPVGLRADLRRRSRRHRRVRHPRRRHARAARTTARPHRGLGIVAHRERRGVACPTCSWPKPATRWAVRSPTSSATSTRPQRPSTCRATSLRETILDIHRALLIDTHPVLAGKWRTEPVWIGSYSAGPPAATLRATGGSPHPRCHRRPVRVHESHRHPGLHPGDGDACPLRDHPPVPRRQRASRSCADPRTAPSRRPDQGGDPADLGGHRQPEAPLHRGAHRIPVGRLRADRRVRCRRHVRRAAQRQHAVRRHRDDRAPMARRRPSRSGPTRSCTRSSTNCSSTRSSTRSR